MGQGAGYKLSVERTPQEIKAEELRVKKKEQEAKKRRIQLKRARLKTAAITAFGETPKRSEEEEAELNKQREKAISGFNQRSPKVTDPKGEQKDAHQHSVAWVTNKSHGFRAASLTERHGRYAKIWLLNAKDVNGNGWGVSQVNLAKNLKSFLGRPYVITAKEFIQNSEYMDVYDHPYINTNDIPTILNYQEKFRVGNIIDVTQQGDDYYATIEVRPKFAHLQLPAFCSPAIFQMDPREDQQKISKWVGLHLAGLDENPAYGARIALLRGTCNGPRGQCMTQLQTAKQLEAAFDSKKNNNFLVAKLTPPTTPDGGTINNQHDVKINPQHGREIADGYDALEHKPNDPKVKQAYDALISETKQQFKDIQAQGLKLTRVSDGGQNPYANSKEMHDDIENNHHLSYFPTEAGFGSDGDPKSDHPLMQETEFEHAGKKLLANDLFRIVHDINGHHHGDKSSFGPKGEHQAYLTHKQAYSKTAGRALFTETAGQNNWVNFSQSHGERNRKDPANTVFAEQKAGLFPDSIINGGHHL